MQKFENQEFFSVIDRGGLKAEGFHFSNCQFVDCGFSLTDEISRRSYASNVTIANCHVCDSSFGPGIVENVTIDGLTTDDTITCYGMLFRHVVFRGKLGKFVFCNEVTSWTIPVEVQQQADREQLAFYNGTDWALDISEAHFDEFYMAGIPAEVVRIDPSRHFVLRRSDALRHDWRSLVSPKSKYWIYVIDHFFLNDRGESTVLVVPESGSKKEQEKMTDGLLELRDLGVVS